MNICSVLQFEVYHSQRLVIHILAKKCSVDYFLSYRHFTVDRKRKGDRSLDSQCANLSSAVYCLLLPKMLENCQDLIKSIWNWKPATDRTRCSEYLNFMRGWNIRCIYHVKSASLHNNVHSLKYRALVDNIYNTNTYELLITWQRTRRSMHEARNSCIFWRKDKGDRKMLVKTIDKHYVSGLNALKYCLNDRNGENIHILLTVPVQMTTQMSIPSWKCSRVPVLVPEKTTTNNANSKCDW